MLESMARRGTISIHALHEESDRVTADDCAESGISIHALHEESDQSGHAIIGMRRDFNPRSP